MPRSFLELHESRLFHGGDTIPVPDANLFSVQHSASGRNLASSTNAKPDFEKEIKPIFQSRCVPCHFQGGKVYDKLPFDKPETITRLGTKLFTRIKDEKEQRLIREFLNQP